jgi:hypothetical protein
MGEKLRRVGYGVVKSWVHLLAFSKFVCELDMYDDAAASSPNKLREGKDDPDREGLPIDTAYCSCS